MNGYSAYTRTQSDGETVRETEAQALLRCALKLEEAQAEAIDYFVYCYAVRQNQKLWTIFQASLADPDSHLPHDLSETLKGLSIYIDRRSLRCIGDFDKSLLKVLININREIAAGLMQRAEQQAGQQAGQSLPTTNQATMQQMPAPSGLNIAG